MGTNATGRWSGARCGAVRAIEPNCCPSTPFASIVMVSVRVAPGAMEKLGGLTLMEVPGGAVAVAV